ncbi:DNA recombination protein RmuC [Sulfurimonas paralvinellae]|uniref:DNA recombination protein RmuC n=1 Tax=Sulfurimonas paralvinellae TaxID=317658 RepID=A0A7M1B5U9_9BACT|nr:DNA recombination protein RmuC [Sulfurimonas paralvinellae]QOP45103.1 DNA recombination protein RmuC [Sulfurimonas paralvinellae]
MEINIYMIVTAVISLLFLIVLFLYLKKKDENSYLHETIQTLDEKLTSIEEEKESLEDINNDLSIQNAVLQSKYEQESAASQEKLKLLQNAKDELSREFKNLSNQIFEDKSKQFSSLNKEQLELLLKPFREQITNFSKEAREQFEVELKERHLLKNELGHLKAMNEQLAQEALNLTKALKSENKTQGNWGEMVLANILEQSGLREGVEYELQATLKSDEGKTYRPDVIIHMPQERDIVIDSKVSLAAYERFVNEDDPTLKTKYLKEHIASISSHIKELSAKKYEKLEGVNTLDFVLMFMPIEGAFLLALEHDGEFFKQAYENNILVVSPSTLLVTLRTIEHIWRTQRQEEHAQKIAKEAEGMYEKLVGFVEELQKVGTHLGRAQESYDTALNRLQSGRGNVIRRAENIVKLGLRPKKELPLKSDADDES